MTMRRHHKHCQCAQCWTCDNAIGAIVATVLGGMLWGLLCYMLG